MRLLGSHTVLKINVLRSVNVLQAICGGLRITVLSTALTGAVQFIAALLHLDRPLHPFL